MSDEPFLARWSRRKQEAGRAEPPPEPPLETASPPSPPAPEVPPPEPLPPIESLGPQSDYTPFLKSGVPPVLKAQALARLWASNPQMMAPEVMDLHMGDYTQTAVVETVKTAWRFGKGVLDAVELEAEERARREDGTESGFHPEKPQGDV